MPDTKHQLLTNPFHTAPKPNFRGLVHAKLVITYVAFDPTEHQTCGVRHKPKPPSAHQHHTLLQSDTAVALGERQRELAAETALLDVRNRICVSPVDCLVYGHATLRERERERGVAALFQLVVYLLLLLLRVVNSP